MVLSMNGVRVGAYDLQVFQSDYGRIKSTANSTIVADITITGIAPNKGSISGNTKVVITGTNLKHSSAYVSMGAKNNTCKIIKMTNTEITCVTGRFHSGKARVAVTVRGTDQAICSDTTDMCAFNYDEGISPKITDAHKEFYVQTNGDSITFTGSNLLDSSITQDNKNAVLMLNDEYFIYSSSQSATELNFLLNNDKIQAGIYMMRIYVKPFGLVKF